MATYEIRAENRTVLGKKVRRLREQGVVPGNVYGRGDSQAVQLGSREVETLLGSNARTGLVSLLLGNATPQPALVKSYQRDPRTGNVLHVDFQAVSMTQAVSAAVPLRFVGEAPALRRYDAILLHPVTELQVEALARDLPTEIEVDVSSLEELDTSIKVADVKLPEGVKTSTDPDEPVALVQATRAAVEPEEAVGAAPEGEEAPAAEGEPAAGAEEA